MIYRFDELTQGLPIGGKAEGLRILHQYGYQVPQFLVITPDGQKPFFEQPKDFYSWMGDGAKAVRSSGMKEDGAELSFAGQYESYLNLKTDAEVQQAVRDCIHSTQSERVHTYDTQADDQNSIAVIIQEMVDAQYAGVAFSADPVSGRRDVSIINVVEGLGNQLVDGKKEPEHISINNFANISLEGQSKIVPKEILREIHEGLLRLRDLLGYEVDTEWAVDTQGQLYWLQVRPITALSVAHPNELDSKIFHKDEVLTRANIGEMMPGHLTPLSLSTFGRAIEYGIQDFYKACGVQKDIVEDHLNIKFFYNHGFISLSSLYAISDAILLPKNEYIEYSILGRALDRKAPSNPKNIFLQIRNQIKQFRYFGSAKRRLDLLQRLNETTTRPEGLEMVELHQWIGDNLNQLNQAYSHHYCTSGKSGSQYSALISVISGNPKPSAESNIYASYFLNNIEGIVGWESIKLLKNLAREIDTNIPDSAKMSNKEILSRILRDQGELKTTFDQFMHDHGHRCVREAELREKDWSQNPLQLIPILRNIIKNKSFSIEKNAFDMDAALTKLPKMNALKKALVKKIALSSREAVAMRELSKSRVIKFQQKLKFAYLDLADQMHRNGMIEEIDDLFYLTHSELGTLIKGELESSKTLIEQRKRLSHFYDDLRFDEVYYGHPYPSEKQQQESNTMGTVVSQGKVTGRIRIIRTLAEADTLEKGDIMVCQYTDIGWSPYFVVIGGLITEIGSPLSHGAVVAREYGIPALVNFNGAMDFFDEGEMVEINTENQTVITRK